MHELMFLQLQKDRHRTMVHEVERERLAAASRAASKKRPEGHRASGLVRRPGRPGGRSFQGLGPSEGAG
jgi:hypothetical protein